MKDLRQVSGTRGRLLSVLRRSERTIAELAEELGITGNAVRTHMTGLERDGLAGGTGMRDTGGKPARLYAITEAGRELFAQGYRFFLGELVGVVEAREGGAGGGRRVLREAGRRLAAKRPAASGGVRERVEAAAEALRELGGDVEVEETAGGFRLRGYGCPLSAVVAEQPEACVMAEAFVGALVGRPAVERCDHAEDGPRCLFDVKR